jgi:hypothetical protein
MIVNTLLLILSALILIRTYQKGRARGHAEGWSERHFEMIAEEQKRKMRDGRCREFKRKPELNIQPPTKAFND